MSWYRPLDEWEANPTQPAVVAIGTFDGLHLGHQAILRAAQEWAGQSGCRTIALTFDRHPLEVVGSGEGPLLLTMPDKRFQLIHEYGMEAVLIARFDKSLASMEPSVFIREILVGKLAVHTVVVGYNFTFGDRAAGDVAMLQDAGKKYGFQVMAVAPVEIEGTAVSSTRIRQLLQEGRVEEAVLLLGHSFSMPGSVVPGDGRGRVLGFPTANLDVPSNHVIPGDGVYTAWATSQTWRKPALVAIGMRPTFGGEHRTVEVFLLDFQGDLYGQSLEVAFLERLRGILKFPDAESLKRQIQIDFDTALARFSLTAP